MDCCVVQIGEGPLGSGSVLKNWRNLPIFLSLEEGWTRHKETSPVPLKARTGWSDMDRPCLY